ncbi:Dyp-type peroxidase [Pantoea sp. 18069]|uniref:Dyp-type peroxidase n=1 Tax=Pantoea sp. 18069 TaxID=2681415 RepID=UPI001358C3FF|nr:Dyp-type peroxidase [Pantoea sp. 18069]
MTIFQAGILQPVPAIGRYVFFSLTAAAQGDPALLRQSLQQLAALVDGERVVAAFGQDLVQALGAEVPGLRTFPELTGPGVKAPATPVALCLWLRGQDLGELLALTRRLEKALAPALKALRVVEAFRHGKGVSGHGLDLSGYEDGTENPQEAAAVAAAFASGLGEGLDGSSYLALQQWLHDFDAFEAMSEMAQDHCMGRRRSDNEELEDAPESAHVKRTAQEDFAPEAFVLRRSMPWALHTPSGDKAGLMFAAFGCSFYAFEAQMRRMLGQDDGIVDALFRFSAPITGAYLWCPPMRDGRLDLRALSLPAQA